VSIAIKTGFLIKQSVCPGDGCISGTSLPYRFQSYIIDIDAFLKNKLVAN